MTVGTRPAGRYGAPPKAGLRRTRYWVLLGGFVAAGVVIAVVAYRNLGAEPITPALTSYHVTDDHRVTAVFTVDRNDPRRAADCIVFALSADGDEVGRMEAYVPPSGTTVQLTSELRTAKRATTVEFYGCSYQVPSYLTKSMPPSG
jgi:hypothetical protein